MGMQERFEQLMRDHALDDKIHFARRDDGTYAYPGMSTLWQGWQARARIAADEKRELVELLRIARCPDSSNASHGAHPCPWCHERDALLAKHKCDGNHGGPRCADPECWNDD